MRYNKNYDYVIAKTLYNNNFKKAVAFKVASEILLTTPKSIEGRYYRNKEVIDNMIVNIINGKKPWYYRLYKKICSIFNKNTKKNKTK